MRYEVTFPIKGHVTVEVADAVNMSEAIHLAAESFNAEAHDSGAAWTADLNHPICVKWIEEK